VLNASLDDPTLWKPRVQYYEHRPDLSVVAHIVMERPLNDTRNATELANDINRNSDNTSTVKDFSIGGLLQWIKLETLVQLQPTARLFQCKIF